MDIVILAVAFAVVLAIGLFVPTFFVTVRPARWLVFVIVMLLMVRYFATDASEEGSLYRQITWGSMFGLCLYIGIRTRIGGFHIPIRLVPVLYLALVAFVLASALWSNIPGVSVRRAVQLLGIACVALAVAVTSEDRPLHDRLLIPVAVLLCLGLISAALIPDFAFSAEGYRGLGSHKNYWGQFCVVGALVALANAVAYERRTLALFVFAIASVSLALTRSSTALIVYVTVIGAVITWWAATSRHWWLALIGAGLMIMMAHIYIVITGDWDFSQLIQLFLDALGKDNTLTNRTFLWELMADEISRHPWLGTGYGAFWLGTEGPSVGVRVNLLWSPGQAHNGYLDVVNEVGFLGLGLLALVVLVHARNIVLLYKGGQRPDAMFHAAILAAVLIFNITESSLLRTTHLWWVMLSMSIVVVHVRVNYPTASARETDAVRAPGNAGATQPAAVAQ